MTILTLKKIDLLLRIHVSRSKDIQKHVKISQAMDNMLLTKLCKQDIELELKWKPEWTFSGKGYTCTAYMYMINPLKLSVKQDKMVAFINIGTRCIQQWANCDNDCSVHTLSCHWLLKNKCLPIIQVCLFFFLSILHRYYLKTHIGACTVKFR